MKQQKIEIPSRAKAEGKSAERNLPAEILNFLDQGIMMWSAEGTCVLFNTRVLDLLGFKADQIRIGVRRESESLCIPDHLPPLQISGFIVCQMLSLFCCINESVCHCMQAVSFRTIRLHW